ncbi:MAG: tetratricopeptide repeat protein, partial [Polyangiaceae bacterium]
PYTLPLRGLPQIAQIDAAVSAAGSNVPLATLSRSGWTPDRDFVVDRSAEATADGVRSGDLAVFRVHPVAEHHPEPIGSAVVLVDTSASRALDLPAQVRRLRDLAAVVARTQPDATWTLACFDQRVDELFTGPVKAIDDGVLARITARGALGASDLGKAFAWAKDRAPRIGARRVILLSDGVATAGDTDRAGLVADARGLTAGGVERVDALASGGIRDDGVLHAIATAGLAHDGLVLSDADDAPTAARRLGEATRSGVVVAVDGAAWSYPRRLDGVQAGDEVLVYAQIPGGGPVQVSVGGVRQSVKDLRPVERPLLERAWAQAKIASLVDSEATAEDVDAVKREVVAISTSRRVLSPYTALLVLETERDYARFGIDHTALAEVLAVEGSRVVLTHRSGVAIVAPEKQVVMNAPSRSFGMVGLINGASASAATPPPQAPPAQAATGAPSDEMESAKAEAPQRYAPAWHAAPAPAPVAANAAPEGAIDLRSAAAIGDGFAAGGLGRSGRGAARPAAVVQGLRADDAVLREAPGPLERPEPPAGSAAGPYSGRFAEVMGFLAHKEAKRALDEATAWHSGDPGDVMGLVALGESLEATGDTVTAERAYGSIIDLYPSRADLRRMAGERLDRIADPAAADVALDTYRKALEERPDHPSSHRLLAYALLQRGKYAAAFDAAIDGLAHHYPGGRFLGVEQVLREDLGLIGAAWAHAEPDRRGEILGRVHAAWGTVES